jgi:CHAD domain-containing protein
VVSPASVSADVVLADVLDQLARNFLLNDLAPEQSGKLLEATRTGVVFQLPHREPRRRNKVVGQVHQARGSIRRLRSVLQTFPGLFDSEWSSPVLVELSWFGGVLGESRDLDVLHAGISKSLWMVEDEDVQSTIMQQLERRIEASHEHSAVERSTKRYALLVNEIASIGTAAVFDPRAKGPAVEVLLGELKGAWRDVEKARNVAQSDANNENLHELRKELKRLECSCEVLGLIVGSAALTLAQTANDAQQQLGVVHDEAVAQAWLKSLSVVRPELREPLRAIRAFHKAARRDAKRGWRDSIDAVEASWDELRALAKS